MTAARKRNKGRSLLTFPADFTVVDLETTGMTFARAEILEVACVKYRAGVEVGRIATLVRPPGRARIPRFITELTGIAPSMVVGAPTFREIADDVWRFLENELIVGHNVNFDVNFLYDAFEELGRGALSNDFVDTLRLARRTLPELPRRRLVDLCEYYGIRTIHHRALADCDSTRQVLECLRRTARERRIAFPPEERRRVDPDRRTFL